MIDDRQLKRGNVYNIKAIIKIKDDKTIIAEQGTVITAKWETCYFIDDKDNKYYLGQVEVVRRL